MIKRVEADIFEKVDTVQYKSVARQLERQLDTEDLLVETLLSLVISFAEEHDCAVSANSLEASLLSKATMENA